MPPFQLSAICFSIGSIPGLVVLALKPERLKLLRQPAQVWIVGIAGLFGYHFLYFTALRNAPAVEAGLIAYLWPLLIVVGSALSARASVCAGIMSRGAVCGLAGTILIVARNGVQFDDAYVMGYSAALGLRLHLVGIFVADARRFEAGFDRCRHRLLPGNRSFIVPVPSWARNHGLAGKRHAMDCGCGSWPLAGRCCLLCLGLRRQERQYPDPRRLPAMRHRFCPRWC